jgi:DNA-binding GntR family transcriptional regulator
VTVEPELQRVAAPLRKQVTDILRTDIVSSALPPGSRLVESALCARFGVSRPVIREALRQLDAEGLVETLPNQGAVVAELTLQDAQDLYELRAALESLAAELFAERASARDREDLGKAYAALAKAVAKKGLADELKRKDQFYEVLFRGAGNGAIRSSLLGAHARVQMLRSLSMQRPGRGEASLAELRDLTEAAVAGDAGAAGAASKRHVQNAGAIALAELRARIAPDQPR